MRRKLVFVVIAVCRFAAGPAIAEGNDGTDAGTQASAPETVADIAAAEKLYKRECRGCHGPTAKGLASYPRLVGHPADYIAGRLKQYRAGEKLGPNTPLMAPRARKLSDDDIFNLAGFIASLPE
ncbi:MAG: c-type cytochrome [Rhodobacter sp.]|nr:c-type cytochrome [Rhodobacter sp.]